MSKVFGVFGSIGHGLEKAVIAIAHGIGFFIHHPDQVFTDLLVAAVHIGFSDDHILHAVAAADTALKTYIEGHQEGWTAATVQALQHEFVVSTLMSKFGFAGPIAQTLTTIVSKLYATGSSKLLGLVDAAIKHAEAAAGLQQPAAPPATT